MGRCNKWFFLHYVILLSTTTALTMTVDDDNALVLEKIKIISNKSFTNITDVQFTPNGQLLGFSLDGGVIHLINTQTFITKSIVVLDDCDSIASFSFSHDGKYLAAAPMRFTNDGGPDHKDTDVVVLETETSDIHKIKKGHSANIDFVSFSPINYDLVSSSWDNTVRVWSMASDRQNLQLPIQGCLGVRRPVYFSKDGNSIFSVDKSQSIVATKLINSYKMISLNATKDFDVTVVINTFAISPNGAYLATGNEDGRILLWNLESKEYQDFKSGDDKIVSIDFSPDGKTLFVLDASKNSLRSIDIASGATWRQEAINTSRCQALSASSDLIAVACGNTIEIWRRVPHIKKETRKKRRRFRLPGSLSGFSTKSEDSSL